MKPNDEQEKDRCRKKISFDHLTRSISIITSTIERDDEISENFMLSSTSTNVDDHLFLHEHVALMTHPVLATRSRVKKKSSNHSPTIEKNVLEKKFSHHHYESSDSGVDLSLSTNSSLHHVQQQNSNVHRPLSALNEDSIIHEKIPSKFPSIYLRRNDSIEDENNCKKSSSKHRSTSFIDGETRKDDRKSSHTSTDFYHRRTNPMKENSLQPFSEHQRTFPKVPPVTNETNHSLIVAPTNSSTKTSRKINIIIEPSSRFALHHDEQKHSIASAETNSSRETTPRSIRVHPPRIKGKANTPLGHYPNAEQIRAHINRSVIERQHRTTRKGIVQQMIPFDATPLKVNHRLVRQYLQQPITVFHPEFSNGQEGQLKMKKSTSSSSPNCDVHLNEFDVKRKHQTEKIKEQNRTKIKPMEENFPSHHHLEENHFNDEEKIKQFFSSSPRRHFRQENFLFDQQRTIDDIQRRQNQINVEHWSHQPTRLNGNSTVLHPIGSIRKETNQTIEHSSPSESESLSIHRLNPFSIRQSKAQLQIVETPIKLLQGNEIHQTKANHSLRVVRLQPMNFANNSIERKGEIPSSSINGSKHINQQKSMKKKIEKTFQRRSPTSWSVISKHQSNQRDSQRIPSSSAISNEIDQRFPLPTTINPLKSIIADSPSQTSSYHTYPFTCTAEFETIMENNNEINFPYSSKKTSIDDDPSSSDQHWVDQESFHLFSSKLTTSIEEDDLSTNYDSDDGWSNDSADILYSDEFYFLARKKTIPYSSSFRHRKGN